MGTSGTSTPIKGIQGLTYTRALDETSNSRRRRPVNNKKSTWLENTFLSPRTPPLIPKSNPRSLHASSTSSRSSSPPPPPLPHYAASTTASKARSYQVKAPAFSARQMASNAQCSSPASIDHGKHHSFTSSYSNDSAIDTKSAKPRVSIATTGPRPSLGTHPRASIDKASISLPLESRASDSGKWARRAEYDLKATQDAVKVSKTSIAARARSHVRSRSKNDKMALPSQTAAPPSTPVRIRIQRGQRTFYHSCSPSATPRPTHPLERPLTSDSVASTTTAIWTPFPPARTNPLTSQPSTIDQNARSRKSRTSITPSTTSSSSQSAREELKSQWYESSDDDTDDVRETKSKGRAIEKRRRLFKRLAREKDQPSTPAVTTVHVDKQETAEKLVVDMLRVSKLDGGGQMRDATQSSSRLPISTTQRRKKPMEKGMAARWWDKVLCGFSEKRREEKIRRGFTEANASGFFVREIQC